MNFIYSINDIDNLWSFTKYVFSIGTYEKDCFDQLMFPLATIRDTIIFAIDQEYRWLDTDVDYIVIEKLIYYNVSTKIKQIGFYNKEHNHMIIFVKENIQSSYKQTGTTRSDFLYTLQCKPTMNHWLRFERFLIKLLEKNKQIYINNWAFFNTRYFEKINEKMQYRFQDTGHYFENFPELGYTIYSVYKMFSGSEIYITSLEKIKEVDSIFSSKKKDKTIL